MRFVSFAVTRLIVHASPAAGTIATKALLPDQNCFGGFFWEGWPKVFSIQRARDLASQEETWTTISTSGAVGLLLAK